MNLKALIRDHPVHASIYSCLETNMNNMEQLPQLSARSRRRACTTALPYPETARFAS
jgi:hypothetical protein